MPATKPHMLMPGYKFIVYMGKTQMFFSKVTSIEYEVTEEVFQEGGVNNYVHIAAAPRNAPCTVVFERGVSADPDEIKKINQQMKQGLGFKPGTRLADIHIFVRDFKGKIQKEYYLSEPYVKKWSMGDLDAASSSIMIERFEVLCTQIICAK